jgi:hypothetical protein
VEFAAKPLRRDFGERQIAAEVRTAIGNHVGVALVIPV